jgi:hypothetical protein
MQRPGQTFRLRKKRDFGEVLGETIIYLRQAFKPLFLSILLISGPFIFLATIYNALNNVDIWDSLWRNEMIYRPWHYIETVLLGQLFFALSLAMMMTTVYSFMKHQMLYNTIPSVEETWKMVKANLWSGIVTVVALFIFFGLITSITKALFDVSPMMLKVFIIIGCLLLYPYLYVKLSFAFPASVLGGKKGLRSLPDSWENTIDNFWVTLGLLFVLFIIYFVLAMVIFVPIGILTSIYDLHMIPTDGSTTNGFMLVFQILGMFITYLGYVLLMVSFGLHYLSVVEKNEGLGLMERIERLDNDNAQSTWGEEQY